MSYGQLSEEALYYLFRSLGLSQRETEVARALLVYKTDLEVADSLHISRHTVHTHRMNIYRKTAARDRASFILLLQEKRDKSN